MSDSSLSEIIGCLSGYDANALPVSQAQKIILQCVKPLQAIEQATLQQALGRVLADDIISPINVPQHDNAAMDGYALHGAALDASGPNTLNVIGTVAAGSNFDGEVQAGQCVRIMTGAPMPAGCDTVVPHEITQATPPDSVATEITIPKGAIDSGDNRRLKGEDLQAGKPALLRGRILKPSDLGLLASLGVGEVPVYRRLRVAVFSTGDELRSIGEPLEPGCVYDSNRYTLHAMLTRLGCDIIDMGVVKDEPALLEAAFRTACEQADAVITSGGVSAGTADHTRPMMAKLGDVHFWKIGMRPGRPMAFGSIASNGSSAFLFGLPGNPVAVIASFYFLVRDALLRMMGATLAPLPLMQATSIAAIRKRTGRTEYQRGILSIGPDGRQTVRITGSQGSGILSSMSSANCMVVLHHDQGPVDAGDMVDVIPFDGLV